MQNIFADVNCLETGLVIMVIHCLCIVEINISLLLRRVGSINLPICNKGAQFSYFFVFKLLRKCIFFLCYYYKGSTLLSCYVLYCHLHREM